MGRGAFEKKQVGYGVTTARQRASRLAGLVWFPAGWSVQTAVGRQALRLVLQSNMIWKSRRPFALQKWPPRVEYPNPRYLTFAPHPGGGAERR